MKKFLLFIPLAFITRSIFSQSDYSSTATIISVNSSCTWQSGTTNGATQSVAPENCNGSTSPTALDVWYKFTAISSSGTIQVTGSLNASPIIDLRNGAPGTSIAVACDPFLNQPVLNYSGLTVCSTYYIRVYHFGTNATDNFQICVTGTGSCGGGTPSITSISPDPVPCLNSQQTISIYGSNLSSSTQVTLNDLTNGGGPYYKTPTIISSTQIQITANFTANTATWSAQVTAPSTSNTLQFQVQCSGCTISGVTPSINSPGTSSSPGQAISTLTPTLNWNAVSGAGIYGVYVRDMISNTLIINDDCTTSGTSYTIPSGYLVNNGEYRWNIIAYQSCGSTCSTSAATPLYFNVQICNLSSTAPTISNPGTGTAPGQSISTTTPTLTWNAVSGASTYEINISIYPYGTANIIYTASCLSGTSHAVPSGELVSGGQYRWDIEASDYCGSGCVSQISNNLYFTVSSCTPPSTPVITPSGPITLCSGSYAILNVSAPNCVNCTYTWSTGVEGTSTWAFVGGDYNVTVSNGCPPNAISATVTVIEDSEIYGSTSTTNTTAYGSCDGSASVSATGGTPPYTYSWSNNSTTQTVSGLCAGNYSVTVNDAYGCGVYFNVTISQPVNISESSSDFQFNIFPNPNNGIFTLEFLSFPSEKIELSVYNLLGETIYGQNISELKTPIDLSKNPCGIYFIQIKIGKEISNKLLIRQ